jgi:hypothetical protein
MSWTSARAALGLVLLLASQKAVDAQATPENASLDGSGRPPYALLRDDENWSRLRRDGPADTWDPIKFIPLASSGDVSLSLGGEVRQQYERMANEGWGTVPWSNAGYVLQRYMFHADLKLQSRVRLFGQLKSGLETGRPTGPRPIDEDRLDVEQAFVDVDVSPLRQTGAITVRFGRQEMNFGSARLVSVREGPNVRQTFDAVRAIVKLAQWRVDAFASRPVTTQPDFFGDRDDPTRTFWGIYAVHAGAEGHGVDLYYLGLTHDHARFDAGVGNEHRQTVGTRLWRNGAPIDYNFELVWQGGRFGAEPIHAWTVASDTGWHPARWKRARIGLRADVTSGDADRTDHVLGTFNPLFPKGVYFGRVDPLGPENHMDLHPELDITLARNWQLTTGWLWFWRTQIDDGLYGISGQLLFSGKDTYARFVGHSPEVGVERAISRHLSVMADVGLFTAGPFLVEEHAPKSIFYLTGMTTYKF